MNPEQIRKQITKTIIETLEKGEVPFWKRGWNDDPSALGMAKSLSTCKPYNGINQWILQAHAMIKGYQSCWFGTFNQIKFNGASVKKGEKACKVVLYKKISRERKNTSGKKVEDSFMMMREFSVFSVEQTTGMKEFQVGYSQSTEPSFERYEKADQLFAATGAEIRKGGNKAYYCPVNDFMQMPFEGQFDSRDHYYGTLAHEMIHWSEKRIGLERTQDDYGFLELVAELGSTFILSELGIGSVNLNNSSAYISGWLKGMKGDTSFIFKAASAASKAVDYLMACSDKETDEAVRPILNDTHSLFVLIRDNRVGMLTATEFRPRL